MIAEAGKSIRGQDQGGQDSVFEIVEYHWIPLEAHSREPTTGSGPTHSSGPRDTKQDRRLCL